jgi:transketolase
LRLSEPKISSIKNFSKKLKKNILDMALHAGSNSAHIGGALSLTDIVACLYSSIIKIDKTNPENEDRDRFILSKGHACLILYSALMEVGIISKSEIKNFESDNIDLPGHPVINRKKGIEFSNGSLGMGLSVGIGVALALKKKGKKNNVYVAMGDGECNEGSVWEAAMAAYNFKIDNLVAIIDKNNFQQSGSTDEIMKYKNLMEIWSSFGWNVIEIDGHNIEEIYDSLTINGIKDKPKLILANTIKGKGLKFAENKNEWHHSILTQKFYDEAIKDINND